MLSVYDGAAGTAHPRRIATLLDYDDGVNAWGLRQIDLRETKLDTLVADSLVFADSDASCCPSYKVVDRWSWDGSRFRRGPRSVSRLTEMGE